MRAGRVRTVPLEEVANTAASSGGDAQHRFEQLELAKTLFNAIKRLSENERIVVMLFYVEEHSQSEIGDFLGVPVTTVAKRLYSARSRLRSTVLEGFNRRLAAHRPSRNQSFAQKVKAGIYDEYVGQYQFETRPDLIVTIRRDRDKLFSEGGGQTNRLSAKRNSPNELIATEFDGCGKFLRDSQGHISHLVYYEFGRELGRAMKIA
jgi:hypothetical protein